MFPRFSESRLLVHIAFHYVAERLTYIEQVLRMIDGYEFASIDVVIDTNTPEFELDALRFQPREPVSITRSVHEQLDHPFRLTWQHRVAMEKAIGDYDYFMYIEDDILVPFEALCRWREDSSKLDPLGYLRGFVRYEKNEAGTLVVTDQTRPARLWNFVSVGREVYYHPRNPYHGFWVCGLGQMRRFMENLAWRDGNHAGWAVRERAAAGMTWANPRRHRTLIPVEVDGTVPSEVLVHHIPNNYALDPANRRGTIPVEGFPGTSFLARLYTKMLRMIVRLRWQ